MENQNLSLKKILEEKSRINSESKPIIFNLKNQKDCLSLEALFKQNKIQQVSDDYKEQQRELFAVNNPALVYTSEFQQKFQEYFNSLTAKEPLWQQGRWIYFPWLSTLTHLLEDQDFQKVRTARNRNLITQKEQEVFYNSVIGIGGLSVGNSVVLSIVLQGGGKHFRIADHDALALSNLNRIRAGIESLGLKKVEMTARQIYALNPYATVEIFPDGLTKDNLEKFFAGPPKLDIVIDELDTMGIKLLIREKAKKYNIAVAMGADNGDNIIVDIERYDLNPETKHFHDRLGAVTYEELSGLDKFGIGKTITKFLGPENITERMQQSLLEMGKTIVSWPQLGGAALLNGVAVAYCVRKILNKEQLESNRAIISLDEHLIPEYDSQSEKEKRRQVAERFKKMFQL